MGRWGLRRTHRGWSGNDEIYGDSASDVRFGRTGNDEFDSYDGLRLEDFSQHRSSGHAHVALISFSENGRRREVRRVKRRATPGRRPTG